MHSEILLAEPRGFCAGVDRAIEIVERALKKFGAPIYVRHEIVHNTFVVADLKAKGAIFIEDLAEVLGGEGYALTDRAEEADMGRIIAALLVLGLALEGHADAAGDADRGRVARRRDRRARGRASPRGPRPRSSSPPPAAARCHSAAP